MSRRKLAVNPVILLRGLALIASLVAIGFLVRASGIDGFLNEAWIDRHIRGQGVAGELLFVAVGALATAVSFPRQIIAFLGGYAFGALEGTMLSVAATVGGCMASFAYARVLGRDLVARRYSKRIRAADAFFSENPLLMTILLRFLPVGNNLLTCLVAGVTSVRAVPFFVGSAIGYLPQSAAFALAGSGVHLDPIARTGLAVALFVGSSLLGVYLYRRYRHGRMFDAAVEEAVDDETEHTERPAPGQAPHGPRRLEETAQP